MNQRYPVGLLESLPQYCIPLIGLAGSARVFPACDGSQGVIAGDRFAGGGGAGAGGGPPADPDPGSAITAGAARQRMPAVSTAAMVCRIPHCSRKIAHFPVIYSSSAYVQIGSVAIPPEVRCAR